MVERREALRRFDMFYTPARRPVFNTEVRSVDRALERMLSGALSHANPARAQANQNGVHQKITQDDTAVTLALDVPGLAREQLAISIDANIVRIESVEGAPRTVKLAYELAQDIDVDASSAKLENGVLTITLTRLAPVQTARTLAIS